jgi:lysozyme
MSINRARLEKQLRADEGERLKPYRCTAGKLTIGVGRNLDDRGITKEESAVMLDRDIRNCLADLAFFLPWYKQLNAARQEALINMVFTMGIARLRGFKNMLAALQTGDWQKAHDEALFNLEPVHENGKIVRWIKRPTKWAREVGERANRIAKVFLTGEATNA